MYDFNDHLLAVPGPFTGGTCVCIFRWLQGALREQHSLVGWSNRHHSRDTGIPRLQVSGRVLAIEQGGVGITSAVSGIDALNNADSAATNAVAWL